MILLHCTLADRQIKRFIKTTLTITVLLYNANMSYVLHNWYNYTDTTLTTTETELRGMLHTKIKHMKPNYDNTEYGITARV